MQQDRLLRLGHLAQGRDIVQDPDRAAVGAENQVIAVDRQVAHGGVRQIQL